jgi:hypothetical protein
MSLPPLAGLATYQHAAQIGYDVNANVDRFCRYIWFEKRLMDVALYWLASTPQWEAKEALGLHAHLGAMTVAALRKRVREMRSPAPRMDISPDAAIDRFFEEVLTATDTFEKIVGVYGVLRPALLQTYRTHYAHSNPIADYPTRYMLRHIIVDAEDIEAWGQQAVQSVIENDPDRARAHAWMAHLQAWLHAAGGIMGVDEQPTHLPAPRATAPFTPDYFPQRDERFAQRWNFTNPQRQVSLTDDVPLDERTLALMCRRIVEMDVPEYMARIIAEAQHESWEYYVDLTRQLWDEVRHAQLGTIYFEHRGVDWKTLIAIHPGMAIRLHTLDVHDAHNVLYAIEQNLMPATGGKRLEYEISRNAHDPLAAFIQDYDWADEVVHVHMGRIWLLPALHMKPNQAVARGWELRAATAGVLNAFEGNGEQKNWWPPFVREVLKRDTAMRSFDLARL